mgnify:CR=1 FL=1
MCAIHYRLGRSPEKLDWFYGRPVHYCCYPVLPFSSAMVLLVNRSPGFDQHHHSVVCPPSPSVLFSTFDTLMNFGTGEANRSSSSSWLSTVCVCVLLSSSTHLFSALLRSLTDFCCHNWWKRERELRSFAPSSVTLSVVQVALSLTQRRAAAGSVLPPLAGAFRAISVVSIVVSCIGFVLRLLLDSFYSPFIIPRLYLSLLLGRASEWARTASLFFSKRKTGKESTVVRRCQLWTLLPLAATAAASARRSSSSSRPKSRLSRELSFIRCQAVRRSGRTVCFVLCPLCVDVFLPFSSSLFFFPLFSTSQCYQLASSYLPVVVKPHRLGQS